MIVDTPFFVCEINRLFLLLLYFNVCKSVQYGGNTSTGTKMRSEHDDCVTSKNWS